MERGGRRGSKGHSKSEQGGRKDRRSATGTSGEPKKGGHGGKFTWAGDQRYSQVEYGGQREKLDAKDPNFEDPAEEKAATV